MAPLSHKDRFVEVVGLLLIAGGLLLITSLISYNPLDPSFSTSSSASDGNLQVRNLTGRVGAYLADTLFVLFGTGAYLIPVFILYRGWRHFKRGISASAGLTGRGWGMGGGVLLLISFSAFCELYLDYLPLLMQDPIGMGNAGGWVGKFLSDTLLRYFAPLGTHIVVLTTLLLSFLMVTAISLKAVFSRLGQAVLGILAQASVSVRIFRGRMRRHHAAPRQSIQTQNPPKIIELPITPAQFKQEKLNFPPPGQSYQIPSLSLLEDRPTAGKRLSKEELLMNSKLLEKRFLDFGVEGKVTAVHPGPVVTLFEYQPAPGVKVQRIANLADDLALAMKAMSVRIVTPLPGKSTVGIEIPNAVREDVSLKEILASEEFHEASSPSAELSPPGGTWRSGKLTLALGKDIFGKPVVVDLVSMPHVLVAGATGSGKSVALNTMLLSLLFSAMPQEVKLLLIDPKRLELSMYENIPHLIAPVIYKAKEAARVLHRIVEEMQTRYRILAEQGVRNIEGYNQKFSASGGGSGGMDRPQLPYIVVIIDELADLMLISAREVEDELMRLAQMARAAGIHLIVATQRPSVDVLTGIIKANFSARISFQVSSKTDSRTILDTNGAEQLLGKGDMLFLAPGTGRLVRVHGAYISEGEIQKVAEYIRGQGQPDYKIQVPQEPASAEAATTLDERDDLYEQAVQLVVNTGQASASFIQRRMRVGYPRAARMIEMMEEDGLIGPAAGGKAREVLTKQTMTRKGYEKTNTE
ncbi:MAG: DNA translocase FtsK [Nitrospiria bacterium]